MALKREIVGVPNGTRLQALVLVDDGVHIWTACRQRGPDYTKWQGTYLYVKHDGSITRVTVDDNYTVDDEFVIKEKDR